MNSKNRKSAQFFLSIRSHLRAGKIVGCTLKQVGKNGKPNKYWCCNRSGSCWPVWSYGTLPEHYE